VYEKFKLDGQIALVTGGSRGIGKAIAIGLAECGADVAILSRDSNKSSEVLDKIKGAGKKSIAISCDVSKISDISEKIDYISDEFGPINILVNSAGSHVKVPSFDLTESQWDEVFNTNIKGLFWVCKSVGKRMAEIGGGSIINIASLNGLIPFPDILAYSASKAGVIMLTKSLAGDWGRHGIRVNAIAPGVIPTDLNREALKTPGRKEAVLNKTPMERLGQTEDIVGPAIYLASPASAFVTGQTIVVDGGFLAKGI
jgi:NAD(P)-dependent dehydrogenase (short-subunit alcohol dehydrogenase family)